MADPEYGATADTTLNDRRSFMKKGALATGALALGLGSAGTAAAQGRTVLVYTDDYYPNVRFRVVQQLEQSLTVRLLQLRGRTVPEISQPDDFVGYVIRYLIGDTSNGGLITTFLFTRGGNALSEGSIRRLSGDASVYSSRLNLLSTSIRR